MTDEKEGKSLDELSKDIAWWTYRKRLIVDDLLTVTKKLDDLLDLYQKKHQEAGKA